MLRSRHNRGGRFALLVIVICAFQLIGADAKQPSRIIGGKLANESAHAVALTLTNPDGSVVLCGGGIIGPRHVLTAAHCVHTMSSQNVTVHAGFLDLREMQSAITREVAKVIVHPQFVPFILKRQNMQNDLAILVLKDALPTDDRRIESLRLPTRQPQMGVTYEVSGWGRSSVDPNIVQLELKTLGVQLGNAYACRGFVPHTICVYADNGAPCFGDSGSSLVGGDYIYGIVSTVSCEVEGPAGFVNVYDYVYWIRRAILENP